MARPLKEIDMEALDRLALAQCKDATIAKALGMTPDGFHRRLESDAELNRYLRTKKAEGKTKLAQAQYDLAVEDKNPVMLVWLGKQYLDQTDKKESKVEVTTEDITKETKSMEEWEQAFEAMAREQKRTSSEQPK